MSVLFCFCFPSCWNDMAWLLPMRSSVVAIQHLSSNEFLILAIMFLIYKTYFLTSDGHFSVFLFYGYHNFLMSLKKIISSIWNDSQCFFNLAILLVSLTSTDSVLSFHSGKFHVIQIGHGDWDMGLNRRISLTLVDAALSHQSLKPAWPLLGLELANPRDFP